MKIKEYIIDLVAYLEKNNEWELTQKSIFKSLEIAEALIDYAASQGDDLRITDINRKYTNQHKSSYSHCTFNLIIEDEELHATFDYLPKKMINTGVISSGDITL